MAKGGKGGSPGTHTPDWDKDWPPKPKPQPKPKLAKKKKRDKLKVAKLPRLSGSGDMTNQEFKEAMRIIRTSSPNDLIRKKRENLLIQQAMKGV